MHDLTVVAIKKYESRLTTGEETIQRGRSAYLNEVVLLSHVVHTNVVKIDHWTKIPVLVYEFISNGTLSDHLYVEGEVSLAWSDRIRISTEVAKAVSYLHSVASVSQRCQTLGFQGIWESDHAGTVGYMDPVYAEEGRLSDKSDVYSFGKREVQRQIERQ
ncbi:hypothetical protein EJB05_15689, partial [Eragrostis curvula]